MYHQPKVSVIIPAYNSEEFLHKSLASVLNQSLKEIQIILIDDGSVDKTPSLLQRYKMQDNRVETVIHEKNTGLGAARNSGLDISNGAYILFLDSDDYIEPDALEFLYQKAAGENLDILQAQYIEHGKKYRKITPPYLPVYSEPITGTKYFHQKTFIQPMACVKLWKTDFLRQNQLKFFGGYFEDMYFTIKAYTLAKRINNIEFPFYHYIAREDSITRQKITDKHIEDYRKVLDNLQKLLEIKDLSVANSNFPVAFNHYLVEFVKMGLSSKNSEIISAVKNYVEQTNQKYRHILIRNTHMSLAKRLLMCYSPFAYAKIKKKFRHYFGKEER